MLDTEDDAIFQEEELNSRLQVEPSIKFGTYIKRQGHQKREKSVKPIS
jgi:ABC-type enterochelin transport system ATPase subunit